MAVFAASGVSFCFGLAFPPIAEFLAVWVRLVARSNPLSLTFFASLLRPSKQNMITIAPPNPPALPHFRNISFGLLALAGRGPIANNVYNLAVGANVIKDQAVIAAFESEARGG